MSNLAARISALSPEQRALLEKQLQAERRNSLTLQTIARRREADFYPLSLEQEHLWFLDQMEPGSSAYNISSSFQLSGVLDFDALERSFGELTRRHESLRTSFPAVDGQPRQVIAPSATFRLPMVDLAAVPEAERGGDFDRLVAERARVPFDMSKGPLIRACLFRLGETEHRLLVTLHHIITDKWSFALLWRELTTLYAAFSKGLPSPLPEHPIQFADYALWQRQWLEGEVLEKLLAYWKKQLAGAPFVLDLPADRPRPAHQTFGGKRQYRTQPRALWSKLKALCQQEGTTPFMTLLAAFYVLLYRYTGQADILVGSPYANRNRVETEGLIGYLLNMLVLRGDVSGDPSFRELLVRVREMAAGAYANSELPFAKLIEELQPERDLSRNPIFQVTFVFVDFPETVMRSPELTLRQVEVDAGAAIADFMLGVRDHDEQPTLIAEYNTDLFDDATAARMLTHFETLLEAVVNDPGRRVSTLPLMTPAEQLQTSRRWNETARPYPRDLCAHELFEAQAAATPVAVAVVHEEGKLSYAELNRRANAAARALRARGVGPDVHVGIMLERNAEMLVALFAVLKAGGCYVPLDISYPHERLAFIMKDADLSLLLTQQSLVADMPRYGVEPLCVESLCADVNPPDAENLTNVTTPDNLAYVIYTSGSTGTPKGVQIPHCALVNCLTSMRRCPGLEAGDVVLALTSLSFDISMLELLLPLVTGATVVVASRAAASDAERLSAALDEGGVTVMQATPATWRLLVESGWKGRRGLKMLSGGEALGRELAHALTPLGGSLWNLYGPTETTIYSTVTEVGPSPSAVTIGGTIANTCVYVLDDRQNLVPVGVAGELCIGGCGLARGYLNRPALTAEKFIPDPFADEEGARLYRTGDLVRRLADGSVEFLGRLDHQVKVRGFRIELGEIEAALASHPAVGVCVVVAREEAAGDIRLTAYVVTRGGVEPCAEEWRAYLKAKLPEYMVPSAFVRLDALPLTPNGKLDRRALPAPNESAAAPSRRYVAPRTPVQEILAGVWGELLRVGRVGIHDNFFDLGGHSLLATQVISRVRDTFRVELPLRSLFERPTISELADRVESAVRSGELPAHAPLVRVPREDVLPLSFTQQRLWLFDKLEPNNTNYNMSATVRLRGQLRVGALRQALNEVVGRHETLRTNFAVRGGEPAQILRDAVDVRPESFDLSGMEESAREAELRRVEKQEAGRPFALESDPLLRVTLVRLGDDEHVVLITLHHIVCDAWSIEILIRELAAFYDASVKGEPARLPELPIQYADFAAHQRRWLAGSALQESLEYWRRQLGGTLPVLELPTDHPRPPAQTFGGSRLTLSLSPETTAALRTLSHRSGATMFMTLLAAFKLLLHHYSAQQEIVVGTPVAGRHRAEIEPLIGLFIDTLVLRTDLSGDPSFSQLLGRVREVALGAYAHQELPFERLLEDLQPARDLSRSPLFQVMFNLLNLAETQIALPDLVLEAVQAPEQGSKFDLTLYAFDRKETLSFTFVYNTALFEEATVAHMVERFDALLSAAVQDPGRPVSALLRHVEQELRRPAGREPEVPRDAAFVEFPRAGIEQTLAERFEQQARLHGGKTAVKTGQHEWSYAELNRRANAAAHALLAERGSGEERVALLFGHGAPMIAGMLGALKAGKVYVPLDPAYPRARNEYVLADAQAEAIVTDTTNLSLASELADAASQAGATRRPLLVVNVDAPATDAPATDPTPAGTPSSLAYLLYTSGSTGQPKGVMQSQRNVLQHVRAYTNALRLSHADRMLLVASYSFDASVMDIYGALLNGATLYPFDLKREGLAGLASHINETRVTVYHSTPSVYRYLMATLGSGERLEGVRLVVLGGEEATRQDALLFKAHFGEACVLVNGLGPTESTLALQYFFDGRTEVPRRGLPVGHEVADTEVRLVNDEGGEVQGYGPGEIEIVSEHVALGYWRRPELTRDAFRLDEATPTRRRYRTGDVARRLLDGSFEYVGRKDGQVKVRGVRVELGEIEAELSRHEKVRTAVVAARPTSRGEQRLVCYVVAREPGATPTPGELRGYLKKRVPEYMIPATYAVLDELPLTPTGKVDRRALPDVPEALGGEAEPSAESLTETQEVMAQLWQEVLGLERVGLGDNFFDLGGHSLLATQVITRVRETFEVEMPLRSLFENATLSEFVAATEESIVRSVEGLSDEEVWALL